MGRGGGTSALALAVGVSLLSGCAALAPIAAEHSGTPTSPTPQPTDGVPLDISFDDDVFDAGEWHVQWVPLFPQDGFSVLSADDGNGSWGHTDDATKCDLTFYQGRVAGLGTDGDDRALTDDFISRLVGGDED